jgi:hypothetical protein
MAVPNRRRPKAGEACPEPVSPSKPVLNPEPRSPVEGGVEGSKGGSKGENTDVTNHLGLLYLPHFFMEIPNNRRGL